jgi:hypothetical protein
MWWASCQQVRVSGLLCMPYASHLEAFEALATGCSNTDPVKWARDSRVVIRLISSSDQKSSTSVCTTLWGECSTPTTRPSRFCHNFRPQLPHSDFHATAVFPFPLPIPHHHPSALLDTGSVQASDLDSVGFSIQPTSIHHPHEISFFARHLDVAL